MTIRSVEELAGLDPGTTVQVQAPNIGKREFTRVDGGFDFDGTVVEPKWFATHVDSGQVTAVDNRVPEAGDYFASRTERDGYLVLTKEGDTVQIAVFRRGRYSEVIERSVSDARDYSWHRVPPGDRPEWCDVALDVCTVMAQVQRDMREVRKDLTTARTQRTKAVNALEDAQRTRAAQVKVVVTGTARPPDDVAVGVVPAVAQVTEVIASWRHEFTVTTEPAAGCQCRVVTQDRVLEELGEKPGYQFSFTTDCGRH